MQINSMPLGALGTNCYFIHNKTDVLIVDPGSEANKIIDFLNENELTPQAILLTHAHYDHIGAVDVIRKKYNLNVYIHEAEAKWLEDSRLNGSIFMGGNSITTSPPEKLITPGQLKVGAFQCDVFHTPGHSPGSVSFIFHDEKFIVSGDVLFHHGIGRTDLPGGSIQQLADSIKNKLYQLPEDYTVYPGHGVATTIGDEKFSNPYTQAF